MMRCLGISLALLLSASLVCVVRGELLLFEREISVNRSVNIFDTDQFDLDLTFGDDFFNPTNAVTLFDDLIVSPADTGSSFEASATNDPGFLGAANRVTDASNEFVNVSLSEDQPGGLTEQRGWQESFFFGNVAPGTPPDLAGEEVTMVKLRINSFTLLAGSSGGESSLTVEGQPVDLNATLSIFGIPEPECVCLLCVALTMLGARASRVR